MASHSEPPASEPRYRHVLVPLDGSDFAAAAVRTARVLAERLTADLHAVSVAEDDADVDALRSEAADTRPLTLQRMGSTSTLAWVVLPDPRSVSTPANPSRPTVP